MVWSHITFKIMKILDHKERKIAPLCGLQCLMCLIMHTIYSTCSWRFYLVTCWLEYSHKLCPQAPKYCRLATKLWSEIALRVSTDPSSFAQKPSALKKYIIYIFYKNLFYILLSTFNSRLLYQNIST